MDRKPVQWINCAKCVAIFAVMIDHTYSMIYTDLGLQTATHFAVPLFILLSGITYYLTGEKYRDQGFFRTYAKKCGPIVLTYIVATLIYVIVMKQTLSPVVYFDALIHFNGSLPLYYVALYLQLMLIAKPLYLLLAKIPGTLPGFFGEIIIGTAILLFSIWTTNATDLIGIYGGGGKLLGGTFFFLFYLGMVSEKHGWFRRRPVKILALFMVIGGSLFITWEIFIIRNQLMLDTYFPFGEGSNPPGVTLMIAAVLALIACYGLFSVLSETASGKRIIVPVSWIGCHTLYIFVYHRLFLDTMNHFFREYLNPFGKVLVYFSAMILGSLLMEFLFSKLKAVFKGLCRKTKVNRFKES